MRLKIRFIILAAILFLNVYESDAQGISDSIMVMARAHKDSVILRWAPSSPTAWNLLNSYGYKIERYTVVRDGIVLQNKEMQVLAEVIKPAQQLQWEEWMDKDDFVAVAAQSIFGEEFQLDIKQADVMQIYNKVRELESRYSFALFAADLSANAARLSGIRWADKNVKKNEMYLYRIYSLVPGSIVKIAYGYAYSGPSEAKSLPAPKAPEVESISETSVLLRWETNALRDEYIGYFLERSENEGLNFSRLSNVPMTILQSVVNSDGTAYSSRKDTVDVEKKVMYRVRGINSFGEEGPPSESLVFIPSHKFDYNPAIVKSAVIDNNVVKLSWELPKETVDLKGFEIERSSKADQDYTVISPDILSENQNEFIDKSPASTNYYRVVAVSTKGIRNVSFPHLVQLEDSIPPLPPSGLQATVDSTGIVNLEWNKNDEPDLLGYRIFRSWFRNAEFGQVTVSPIKSVTSRDTVNIKILTNKVYYKVAAVDTRFNTSVFSEILEVELPDVIPPVPPVITGIWPKEGGVEIAWRSSSSEDVVEYHIYRKHQYSTSWTMIKSIGKSDSCCFYFDKIEGEHQYQYALLAVDKVRLKSPLTKPVWGRPLKKLLKPKITSVQIFTDRTKKLIRLSWKYDESSVSKFLIYRAMADEEPTLYRSIHGSEREYSDRDLRMNSRYAYWLKASFKDGTESVFSDKIEVNY